VRLLNIGIYLAFKNLLTDALNETMEKRLPYLMLSAEDFSKNYGEQKFEILVNEMSSSCGFETPIDSGLYQIIKAPNTSNQQIKNFNPHGVEHTGSVNSLLVCLSVCHELYA
jgi:hypothetical protein